MKVYCCNCQHYVAGFSDRSFERCEVAKAPEGFIDTYLERKALPVPAPSQKNANNDCPDWRQNARVFAR